MELLAKAFLLDRKTVDIEEHLKRFRRSYRRRLRRLAGLAVPCAELLVSFPAAAFAIATEYGTRDQRAQAIKSVRAGEPLKNVATALQLPLWLRKLPPEALTNEFPADIPSDPEFGAKLLGMVPQSRDEIGRWLIVVLEGERTCDAGFALWLARHPEQLPEPQYVDAVVLLGAYAWFSEHHDTDAGMLIPHRWHGQMTVRGAVKRLEEWWKLLRQELFLGKGGVQDPWLAGGRAAGYRFVPLLTFADLEAEAEAMDNCVTDYAWKMAHNECRLFSMRRGATHVATLEVQAHPSHDGIPQIVQLLGPDNEDAPDRVWAAAFTWLGKQARYGLPDPENTSPAPALATWQRIWLPYWRAKGQHQLLPRFPNGETIDAISQRIDRLRRAAK
ncbi:MAG: hypothetical protein AAGC70_08595 [Pseudomonadota bacterium]